MGRKNLQLFSDRQDGFFSINNLGYQWSSVDPDVCPVGGLFASVGQMEMNFGLSLNSLNTLDNGGVNSIKLACPDLIIRYVSSPEGIRIVGVPEEEETVKNKTSGLKLQIKVKNPSLRRLISGAVAGAVSRTTVAPLETIRTHLMVGNSGHSTTEVFQNIMKTDGWKGLFRGNLVNVIRVAPSKAIEVMLLYLPFESCIGFL